MFQAVSECQGTNKGEYADFANFDAKIGCHGERSEKEVKSVIYDQIPAIRWKVDDRRSDKCHYGVKSSTTKNIK